MSANTIGIIVIGLVYVGLPVYLLWTQHWFPRNVADDRPTPAYTCVNAGTNAGACKTHCGDKVRCWGTDHG